MKSYDAMILRNMPFSRKTFLRISQIFQLPHLAVRACVRNTSATFINIDGYEPVTRSKTLGEAHILGHINLAIGILTCKSCLPKVYICRSSASWMDDLLLSVTYVPARRYTYAIFFGATPKVRNDYIRQLNGAVSLHPLVLPVLFSDFQQRNKHYNLVERLQEKLLTKAANIPDLSAKIADEKAAESMRQLIDYSTSDAMMLDSTKTRVLRDGIQAWGAQLEEMIHHVEDLIRSKALSSVCLPSPHSDGNSSDLERTPINDQRTNVIEPTSIGDSMEAMNTRILRRLKELRKEYTVMAGTCTTALEVASLANQVVSSTSII